MTSVIGKKTIIKSSDCRAFSLIELLAVIALIALLSSIAVVSQITFFSLNGSKSLPDLLHSAVQECRYRALKGEALVYLTYSEKKGFLVISKNKQAECFSIPDKLKITKVSFIQQLPERTYSTQSEQTVKALQFDKNGFTSPFNIQYRIGGKLKSIKIDPLSGYVIKNASTQN